MTSGFRARKPGKGRGGGARAVACATLVSLEVLAESVHLSCLPFPASVAAGGSVPCCLVTIGIPCPGAAGTSTVRTAGLVTWFKCGAPPITSRPDTLLTVPLCSWGTVGISVQHKRT